MSLLATQISLLATQISLLATQISLLATQMTINTGKDVNSPIRGLSMSD